MSPHHRHGRLQLIPTEKGLATTPLQGSVLGLSWRTLLCAISQGREGGLCLVWRPCTDIMQPKACFSSMPFTSLTHSRLFSSSIQNSLTLFIIIFLLARDWGSQILLFDSGWCRILWRRKKRAMARMVILIWLLLPLLFESDSRKLSWVPDMPGNASATATHVSCFPQQLF